MKLAVRTSLAIAAIAGASAFSISSASALPALPGAPATIDSGVVQDVGYYCGPGWHLNPWGRCVPARRWGGYGYGPGWRRGWGWRHRYW